MADDLSLDVSVATEIGGDAFASANEVESPPATEEAPSSSESAAPAPTEIDPYDALERLDPNDPRLLKHPKIRDAVAGHAGRQAEKLAAERLQRLLAEQKANQEREQTRREMKGLDPAEIGQRVLQSWEQEEAVRQWREYFWPQWQQEYGDSQTQAYAQVLQIATEDFPPDERQAFYDRVKRQEIADWPDIWRELGRLRDDRSGKKMADDYQKRIDDYFAEKEKQFDQRMNAKLRLTEERPDLADGTPGGGDNNDLIARGSDFDRDLSGAEMAKLARMLGIA